MVSRTLPALLAAASVVCSGCGGDDPAGPGGEGDASFRASIDGEAWASDQISLFVTAGSPDTPGSLLISGSQRGSATSYRTLFLNLAFLSGPGTYPLGVNVGTTPGGTGSVVIGSAGSTGSFLTPLSGNAGTLTVGNLTSSRMSGTFAFTAAPILGTGGGRNVTGGSFDVPLPTGFTVAAGDSRGSSMIASLGGTPWNGATVVGIGQTGVFSITGANTSRQIVISGSGVGSGTWAIGPEVRVRVNETGGTSVWGGEGSVGTVTFTSVGPRVTGTFSGTLEPMGGTAGPLTITNGSFDVRLPPG